MLCNPTENGTFVYCNFTPRVVVTYITVRYKDVSQITTAEDIKCTHLNIIVFRCNELSSVTTVLSEANQLIFQYSR